MCSVAILNLPLSRNLALPLPLPSSQVLPVLHLTLLWPGPGWLCSMSLETQLQLSVLKLMLSNLPTSSCYRHLQISWSFLLFHWMFLAPDSLMFSSILFLLYILAISISNRLPSNTLATQFLEHTFFKDFACYCYLFSDTHFPDHIPNLVITNNCSFFIIFISNLTLWPPPAIFTVHSF